MRLLWSAFLLSTLPLLANVPTGTVQISITGYCETYVVTFDTNGVLASGTNYSCGSPYPIAGTVGIDALVNSSPFPSDVLNLGVEFVPKCAFFLVLNFDTLKYDVYVSPGCDGTPPFLTNTGGFTLGPPPAGARQLPSLIETLKARTKAAAPAPSQFPQGSYNVALEGMCDTLTITVGGDSTPVATGGKWDMCGAGISALAGLVNYTAFPDGRPTQKIILFGDNGAKTIYTFMLDLKRSRYEVYSSAFGPSQLVSEGKLTVTPAVQ